MKPPPDAGALPLPTRLERLVNPVLFKDLLTVALNPSGAGARLLLYALLFALFHPHTTRVAAAVERTKMVSAPELVLMIESMGTASN